MMRNGSTRRQTMKINDMKEEKIAKRMRNNTRRQNKKKDTKKVKEMNRKINKQGRTGVRKREP